MRCFPFQSRLESSGAVSFPLSLSLLCLSPLLSRSNYRGWLCPLRLPRPVLIAVESPTVIGRITSLLWIEAIASEESHRFGGESSLRSRVIASGEVLRVANIYFLCSSWRLPSWLLLSRRLLSVWNRDMCNLQFKILSLFSVLSAYLFRNVKCELFSFQFRG